MAVGKECEALRKVSRRKRVVLSNDVGVGFISSANNHGAREIIVLKSHLEVLPQDILIRIICGVDHEDLRALFHVSKTIQEAALIAKKLHFEYSTPKKNFGLEKKIFDFDDLGNFNEVEAPNAPRQSRIPKQRLMNNKKLAEISVALFPDDGNWPRKHLILHT